MWTSAKIRKFLEATVNAIAISIFIFVIFICFYGLFDIQRVEIEGGISAEVKALVPKDADSLSRSISELQKINPEILAWLTLDSTGIDYPVVQTTNNSKYLTHNYKDEYSATGAIFLDYQNKQFQDDYSVVYGHRTSKKLMFSELTSYKNADFFKQHQTGTLYTADTIYDLKVVGFAVVEATSWHVYNLSRNKNGNNQSILDFIREEGQNTDIPDVVPDKLLLLSTCDKNSKHFRNILLLSMTPRE